MSDITITKTVLKKSFETKIGADIIVPDSKNDVANVINAYASVNVAESYISKDKITVSGNISYNIIYNTDEEVQKVSSISYKTPFSHQIDIKNLDLISSHLVKAKIEKVDCTLLNSRKVGVSTTVVLDVVLNEEICEEYSYDTSKCIPVKTESIRCFNNVICYKEDFDNEYQTVLNDTKNILNCFAKISSKDVKVINNKVIIKGSIKYGVIYENENCQINFAEFMSDFTQVLDVAGINPQMVLDIDLMIKETDAGISHSDEENLWINTYLCVYVNAYEECEYDICTDAYSPDYEINTERKSISYQCHLERICDKINASDSIDVSKNGITSLYDTSVSFKHTKQIASDGKIISDGFAFVEILFINGEGKLCAAKKTIPYAYSRDINYDYEALNVKSRIELQNISCSVNIRGEIEIKILLDICVDVCIDKETEFVTSIIIDKSKCIDKTNIAGITIYFVQKGDSLWEIAKKYHTTTEKIAKVNNIDANNIIVPGQRLLIPKK